MSTATPTDKPRVEIVREPVVPLRRGRNIATINAEEIAKPLPDLPFLVDGLGIAAGPPTCFAGYGYSRKTLALQSLALSVAGGKLLWGVHRIKRGRVLHLDYEQGERLTRERYQRLARGMGIDLPGLGDALHLAPYPESYLDQDGGVDAYERACDGFQAAIIDSFRASCPSADENKSDVRKHVDKLARISERIGTVFLLILHARKVMQGGQMSLPGMDVPAGRYSIRGSGALYDALASAFVLHGEKGKPTRVQHEKCRNKGTTVADFGLDTEDIPSDGNPKWGLRLKHMDREELEALTRDEDASLETNQDRILAVFRRKRRVYRGTKDNLRADVKMGKIPFSSAFATLLEDGKIVRLSDTHFALADGL